MNTSTADPLDRVADLRPSDADLAQLWSRSRRAELLQRVTTDSAVFAPESTAAGAGRLGVTRRRRLVITGVAGAAATAAVIAGVVLPSGSPGGPDGAIAAPLQHLASAAQHEGRVGPHQYVRTDTVAYRGMAGRAVVQERNTDWVAPDGADWSLRTGGGRTTCLRFGANLGYTLDSPGETFLARLPTDPATLNRYVRAHVSGSTSTDEAVFVAVGDLLRDLDGLTSGRLRAALIGVLGRTGHVSVHAGVRDVLGRPATRVDFDDPVRRPGGAASLYFDPRTAHLLSEGSPVNGRAGRLVGNADVVVRRTVVDSVPADVAKCQLQSN